MKDTDSIHKKVQEHCDCFATTDPLKEMSTLTTDADKEEAAVKWIALATLHGINNHAKKISITKDNEGNVSVTAKYHKADLPSPGTEIANKVFEAVRGMTHIDQGEGKTELALGIRDSSIGVSVKIEKEAGEESVEIKFPK